MSVSAYQIYMDIIRTAYQLIWGGKFKLWYPGIGRERIWGLVEENLEDEQ